MLSNAAKKAIHRAGRAFHSLDCRQAVYAVTALLGIKRLQDAFIEHVERVRNLGEAATRPGIALLWVPSEFRGAFRTTAEVTAACQALEAENPSLETSLTFLWPAAKDAEVAAAWHEVAGLDLRTVSLLGTGIDILGEAYESLQVEMGVKFGANRGEFFTPSSVSQMMARMNPLQPGQSCLDPACGSGRLLLEAAALLVQEYGHHAQETCDDHPLGPGRRLVAPPPALFVGQDIAPQGPAMGRISLTALGYLNCVFVVRDSLASPVTKTEVEGILEDRRIRLLALQPGHLITDAMPPSTGPANPQGNVAGTDRPARQTTQETFQF